MNFNEFSQQIEELRSRFAALQKRTNESPLSQQDLLSAAFEELKTALEELAGAEEELRQQNEQLYQQNEQLYQQNEELEIARRLVEVERQRYQELFELAPDGYLVTDKEGRIQEANRAAAALLNIWQKFLVGQSLISFLPEKERLAFQSQLTQPRIGDWVRSLEVRLQPRDRKLIDVALTVAAVRNREGKVIALRWLLRDITERKQAEAKLLHKAFYDALTGLPNRALFMNRLERAVEYGLRHQNYLFAVLFLDLDRFKVINDSLGHTFADQLLIAFAGRLTSALRPTDTIARLGGDEFTILIEGLKDISDAIKVAERIQAELKLPFNLGEQEVLTTASIGIALSATGYDQPSDLLRDADIAMYRAKSQGSGRYEIFNTNMHIPAVARLQLDTELR